MPILFYNYLDNVSAFYVSLILVIYKQSIIVNM